MGIPAGGAGVFGGGIRVGASAFDVFEADADAVDAVGDGVAAADGGVDEDALAVQVGEVEQHRAADGDGFGVEQTHSAGGEVLDPHAHGRGGVFEAAGGYGNCKGSPGDDASFAALALDGACGLGGAAEAVDDFDGDTHVYVIEYGGAGC